MSERELLTHLSSLSFHGPLGFATAVGGGAAALHWLDGLPLVLGCALAVGVGIAVTRRTEPHEMWLEGDDLCEMTGSGTRRLPLTRVDDVRYLSGFNGVGTVRVVGGGTWVDIGVDAATEPLRRGVGRRMRQAQSGRTYGDVRAMRSLFM